MFPKMRRFKQEIPKEKCIEILKKEPRGVLAMSDIDGYPYALPMDHYYEDGKLYFHGAKVGTKIDLLKKQNKVSFCVMDSGVQKGNHWSLMIQSVVCFGKVSFIDDEQEAEKIVRRLAAKYNSNQNEIDEEVLRAKARLQVFVLTIESMTGKLVNEA